MVPEKYLQTPFRFLLLLKIWCLCQAQKKVYLVLVLLVIITNFVFEQLFVLKRLSLLLHILQLVNVKYIFAGRLNSFLAWLVWHILQLVIVKYIFAGGLKSFLAWLVLPILQLFVVKYIFSGTFKNILAWLVWPILQPGFNGHGRSDRISVQIFERVLKAHFRPPRTIESSDLTSKCRCIETLLSTKTSKKGERHIKHSMLIFLLPTIF